MALYDAIYIVFSAEWVSFIPKSYGKRVIGGWKDLNFPAVAWMALSFITLMGGIQGKITFFYIFIASINYIWQRRNNLVSFFSYHPSCPYLRPGLVCTHTHAHARFLSIILFMNSSRMATNCPWNGCRRTITSFDHNYCYYLRRDNHRPLRHT